MKWRLSGRHSYLLKAGLYSVSDPEQYMVFASFPG